MHHCINCGTLTNGRICMTCTVQLGNEFHHIITETEAFAIYKARLAPALLALIERVSDLEQRLDGLNLEVLATQVRELKAKHNDHQF